MKIGIVVITYNRIKCLKRLLTILNMCDYNGDTPDLIISVDYSGDDQIINFSHKFEWSHGKKIVRSFEENLGLRNHVIECGKLVKNYDAIVVFEDDIVPSLYFYNYVQQALRFYDEDEKIAGISLYKHLWNVGNYTAFNPETHPYYDTFFMQYAQSWGQVWSKRMWNEFYEWYKMNKKSFNNIDNIPDNVNNWPDSSWLKYFIRYIVEKNKYFVYPYISLSTNCGDAGTHNASSPHYQVELLNTKINKYHFPKLNDQAIKYDVFFERMNLKNYLNKEDICIDLYGMKKNKFKNRYYLTLDKLNYKIINSYSLSLKPIEFNIFFNIEGNDIFLYDTTEKQRNFKKDHSKEVYLKKIEYSSRGIPRKDLLNMYLNNLIQAILRKVKK